MAGSAVSDRGDTPQAFRQRGRWPLVGALSIAGLAAVLAIWWFLWVPNWRPPLEEGERYGIDVSAHQDAIDWRRVADDGITFAYIKATEGGDFTDDRFDENWRGAQDVGLDQGAYHYFTLCTPGADQARHFIDVVPPEASALPPAVDLELAGNCSARPSPSEVKEQLGEFIHLVEEAWGREVILYVGDDFERAYPVRIELDRPLWHHSFLLRPDLDGWLIWQLHGYARVDGIDGGVDLDVMRALPQVAITRAEVGVEVRRDDNPQMGARAESRGERSRLSIGSTVPAAVLVVLLVAMVFGAWAGRTISDAICGSYNFISNDFCDEWNHETPPAGALPVPPSWSIEWRMLDCGSGGCGARLYVLAPDAGASGGVATYLHDIQALGWQVGAKREARQGDLRLDLEPATDRFWARLIPKRLVRPEYIFVSLAICGEGAVCD